MRSLAHAKAVLANMPLGATMVPDDTPELPRQKKAGGHFLPNGRNCCQCKVWTSLRRVNVTTLLATLDVQWHFSDYRAVSGLKPHIVTHTPDASSYDTVVRKFRSMDFSVRETSHACQP